MNLCATATEQNDKNKRAPGMKSQSVFDSNDYYVFRWKSFVVRRRVPFGMSCFNRNIFFSTQTYCFRLIGYRAFSTDMNCVFVALDNNP